VRDIIRLFDQILIGRPALQGHGTTMHAVLFSAMHAANPRPDQRQSSNIVAIKCSHQSPDCSFLVVVRTYVRTYVERAYVPPSASARLCTGRMQTVRSTTTTTRRELDQRLIDLRQARTHGSCIFISIRLRVDLLYPYVNRRVGRRRLPRCACARLDQPTDL
jgi:hypothetical protein